MKWMFSEQAWEAKALALQAAQTALETGRLCLESSCMARSEIGFEVELAGRTWIAGFCGPHAVKLAAELPSGVKVGRPRLLDPEEALNGPAEGDLSQKRPRRQRRRP